MRTVLIGIVLLAAGCSTHQEEDTQWVGHAEGRYVDPALNKFDDRFTASPDQNLCLKNGQTFEIRLQSLIVGWEFEGKLERLSSNDGNELGVFITVSKSRPGTGAVVAAPAPPIAKDPTEQVSGQNTSETELGDANENGSQSDPGDNAAVAAPVLASAKKATEATPIQGGTQTNPVERRLVYMTDSTLPQTDLNGANLLVYSDTYDGSDYTITFEVVEFDAEAFDQLAGIARELAKAAQESGISANLPYSALLTKVGTAMFNSIKRNDKISFYKTSFLPCDSVTGTSTSSVYLKRGEYGIVRVPQAQHTVDWSNITYSPTVKRVQYPRERASATSYMLFSIYGRE
ncbi:hypothetical protein [Aquipseudomonas alcaligenes]|uniref:hypothetical protein n=1 Tax=Aquipseudomonas alcaligenes TaxID=43263 RepID=UPI0036614256